MTSKADPVQHSRDSSSMLNEVGKEALEDDSLTHHKRRASSPALTVYLSGFFCDTDQPEHAAAKKATGLDTPYWFREDDEFGLGRRPGMFSDGILYRELYQVQRDAALLFRESNLLRRSTENGPATIEGASSSVQVEPQDNKSVNVCNDLDVGKADTSKKVVDKGKKAENARLTTAKSRTSQISHKNKDDENKDVPSRNAQDTDQTAIPQVPTTELARIDINEQVLPRRVRRRRG